jgi:cellulose synthase operon protein C
MVFTAPSPAMPASRRIRFQRQCLATLLGAMLALSAAAQQGGAKGAQFYEDALQRFEKKDYPGAIVQLKNVLKGDSKNLSAQVLLGKALLENGEVNAAEVALAEALRLGVNRAEVVVPLARAMILQGKPDDVISGNRFTLEGLPKPTQYQLLLQRAAAATDFADLKAGLKAVEDARALDAADSGSWMAEVPLRIRGRQYKEALAAADKAISLAPGNADNHYARGESLHVVPNLHAALASYDKALAIDPAHIGALVARAGIYMDLNRVDDAARDVATLLKATPREPRGVYLKALVAERQGRAAEARAALNELTALIDPIPAPYLRYRPQTQMLGGMAHYSLGQMEKAKPYLEGMLRSQPASPVAKVLASIYLRERNVDPAIGVLDAYLRVHPGDTQAMTLLASAHMAQGRHARSTQILQDALKLGEQPQLRTSLGMSLIGGGRMVDAIKELEAVFAKDPKQLQAGFALGSLYVQSGQVANALRTAEALNKAHPNNPSVLNLLGAARRLKGDSAGARTAFEAASAADATFVPALVSLARLEMDAQAYAKAAERLNAAFARDERDQGALAAIAELSERTGKLDDAQRWLEKADEHAGADNAGPALALVDFQLRRGNPALAREAIKRAQNKAPDAVQTLVAVARVALANGDATSARSNLARAANSANFNAPLLTQIALLQIQAGAAPAAAYSLDKALGEQPNHLPALALRTEVDIRTGELAKAEQRARQVLQLSPKIGLGHGLMGDLAQARNQPDVALAAYRKAHELDRNSASLLRLFAAQLRRDAPAAIRLAEQWLSSRPADTAVLRALADTQLGRGNPAAARKHYEALLKAAPKDVGAMNNLANALVALKDPGALKVAEQALALAPGSAYVIGTTGWAAFKAGQSDRAIQLLRDARLRDPNNADTRYFLGSVLASQGRNAEARTEIAAALQPASGLSYRSEAEQLLSTLK